MEDQHMDLMKRLGILKCQRFRITQERNILKLGDHPKTIPNRRGVAGFLHTTLRALIQKPRLLQIVVVASLSGARVKC